MSALAEAALLGNSPVSGSDRLLDGGEETQTVKALRAQGAVLFRQDGSGVSDASCVIVSTAIEKDNPDLAEAVRLGRQVVHRSKMLSMLLDGRGERVAVTGTCGKSTVTGMTGWLLEQAGRDASVINGAPLAGWMNEGRVGSSRIGKGNICVFEADESDKSLLGCGCEYAVITNSSADHFGIEETDRLFDEFAAGAVKGVLDARKADFFNGMSADRSGFAYGGFRFEVSMPGRHNIINAFVSVRICELLGCSLRDLAVMLPSFRGISRRLELVGRKGNVSVYDDYAHNTEKIRASLGALSQIHSRVTCIWRPHGYGPLRNMMTDLEEMFKSAAAGSDCLLILPVYDAGGTADRSVNSDELARRLHAAGLCAKFVAGHDEAREAAVRSAAAGGAVVTMGARDPGLPALAKAILDEV